MLKKFSFITAFALLLNLVVGFVGVKAADQTIDGKLTVTGDLAVQGTSMFLDKNHLQFGGSNYMNVDPTIDLHRGDSQIKDMGDMYIMSDDYIHLGPTTYDIGKVLIQTKEEITSGSRSATGTLVAGKIETNEIGANTTGLLFLSQSTTFNNDVTFNGGVGFTGDANVGGDLTVDGETVLNDTLYTNDIMPNSDDEYTIGMYDDRYSSIFLSDGMFVGNVDVEEDPFDPDYQEYTIFGRLGPDYHGSLTIGSDAYLAATGGDVFVGNGTLVEGELTDISGILVENETGDIYVTPDSGNTYTYNILPDDDSMYNLGASGTEWANVYADEITGHLTGNVTGNTMTAASGNLALTSSVGNVLVGANNTMRLVTHGGDMTLFPSGDVNVWSDLNVDGDVYTYDIYSNSDTNYNIGASDNRYYEAYLSDSLLVGDTAGDYIDLETDGLFGYGSENLYVRSVNQDVYVQSDSGDVYLSADGTIYADTTFDVGSGNFTADTSGNVYAAGTFEADGTATINDDLYVDNVYTNTDNVNDLGTNVARFNDGFFGDALYVGDSVTLGAAYTEYADNSITTYGVAGLSVVAVEGDAAFGSATGDAVLSSLLGDAMVVSAAGDAGITTLSGDIYLNSGSSYIYAEDQLVINGTMNITNGSIYDLSGTISFDGNDLDTSGGLSAGETLLGTLEVAGYFDAQGNIYSSLGSVTIYDGIDQQTAGQVTFSGNVDATNGLDVTSASFNASGATANINASSNFATNINTGNSSGAVNIGNTLAGAVSINSSATSNFTVTGASADLNLHTTGGSIWMRATEGVAGAVTIDSSGAGGGIALNGNTGGIAINQAGSVAGNGIVVATADAGVSISAVGAVNGDMTLSAGDVFEIDSVDALSLNSSAGAINIGDDNVNQNINIGTNGTRTITIGGSITSTVTSSAIVDFTGAWQFKVPYAATTPAEGCDEASDTGSIYYRQDDNHFYGCRQTGSGPDTFGWVQLDN